MAELADERVKQFLHTVNRIVAGKTLKWEDENKFTFLWNNELIVGYYSKERQIWWTPTSMGPETSEEIKNWLSTIPEFNMKEDEDDQESGD